MKRWMVLLAATAMLVACGKNKGDNNPGPNPIDQIMEPMFEAEGLEMIEAADTELCRRLYHDLLGRFPTKEEVAKDCAGKTVDNIVRDFQGREDYIWTSMENWRDILDMSDVGSVGVDWRNIKMLFDDVAELQRGNLAYDEFAIRTIMNPSYLLQVVSPTERTSRIFNSFMGRPATDAEMNDLSALFRIWLPSFETDPDFVYTYRITGGIAPILCEPLSNCQAELLGGAELDFGVQQQFEIIIYENLTQDQLDVLRIPGELFVRQPMFYEAAADEILNRYLGWDDGGRFPRTPGVVLPEVRQLVSDTLRETGSYPEAERIVLTSILYRGASNITPDGFGDDPDAPEPFVWQHGPVKYTKTEAWLDQAAYLLGDQIMWSRCDPRYTDLGSYGPLFEAFNDGTIDTQTLADDVARLAQMQEIRMPLTDYDGQELIPLPDYLYLTIARQVGGCPGYQSPRFDGRAGLSYSFAQESLSEQVCVFPDNLMGSDTTPAGVLTHQMNMFLSRDPSPEEITDFEAAFATCSNATEDCSPIGMAASTCVALLGTNESIFN